MKITVNGKISEEALKSILETQKKKTLIIEEYCKKEKLDSLSYKDSELEYQYTKEVKQAPPKPKKVELGNDKRN